MCCVGCPIFLPTGCKSWNCLYESPLPLGIKQNMKGIIGLKSTYFKCSNIKKWKFASTACVLILCTWPIAFKWNCSGSNNAQVLKVLLCYFQCLKFYYLCCRHTRCHALRHTVGICEFIKPLKKHNRSIIVCHVASDRISWKWSRIESFQGLIIWNTPIESS